MECKVRAINNPKVTGIITKVEADDKVRILFDKTSIWLAGEEQVQDAKDYQEIHNYEEYPTRLVPGAMVELIEEFTSNGKSKTILKKGECGKITKISAKGSVSVKFGRIKNDKVKTKNFHKLRLIGQDGYQGWIAPTSIRYPLQENLSSTTSTLSTASTIPELRTITSASSQTSSAKENRPPTGRPKMFENTTNATLIPKPQSQYPDAVVPPGPTRGYSNPQQRSSERAFEDQLFTCPITHERMCDPVIAADGHSYERRAIEDWLSNSVISPITGAKLPHLNLIPNRNLRAVIQSVASSTTSSSTY